MKFPLNRIRPYLAKRLPFLQQEENAPERKTIPAKKLEEICELISPSFSHCLPIMRDHSDDTNKFQIRNQVIHAFLYNNWDVEDDDYPYYWQDFNVSDLQMAKQKIAQLGLSENIKLHLPIHPNAGGVVAEKIEIENLNIEGDFQAELNHIRKIELTNNVFQGYTEIRVIGSPQCSECTFRNNQFEGQFWCSIFNVGSINFIDNIFLKANLSFRPPIWELKLKSGIIDKNTQKHMQKFKDICKGFKLTESHLTFTNNKATTLFLCDHKDLAAPYKGDAIPFGKIEFLGGNAFDYLEIETHHSALNSSSSMRADVNKIFFDVSDEISPLTRTGNGVYSTEDGFDSQAKEHQLSYLEFFSLLKRDAAKQHNPVLEDIYAKKIRYFSRVLVSRWQDKFIFHWGNWISDGGESWTKPLGWFVSFQFALSFMAWLSVWSLEPSVSFWALFFEFLNPLSDLSSLESSKTPAWTAFLLLFHKLVAAVTIYEAIKALRRFSK